MKLLFIITKGIEKAGSALRALQLAAVTADLGHHVEVFLFDEAVHWAQGIEAADGETLEHYLDMLQADKHPVMVCKSCLAKRRIAKDSLIAGTVVVEMPQIAAKLADPDYKVFTF
jgi:sulfur relay (sulfurtransferase) complex TusBCD TusD component (DsrE family)